MTNINDKKNNLLDTIYRFFVESSDYNGIPMSNLNGFSLEELCSLLTELIDEDKVCLIAQSHDENPHINRFGFVPKAEQTLFLSYFKGIEPVCLYPSPAYLSSNRNIEKFTLMPFAKMMALGQPQFRSCHFQYDILMHYAFNPKMRFKFNDYQGEIKSAEDIDKRQNINLNTFGIGRCGSNFTIVSFPRYLSRLSSMHQVLWYGHLMNNDDCKTLQQYQNNLFRVSWSFPNTVYRSILEEMHNINELTEIALGHKFFRTVYDKNDLEGFDMLPFPSLNSYNDFLLLIEKVVISNIDDDFFNGLIETYESNGKKKGTLACLKEWMEKVCKNGIIYIHKPLHDVRKLRQTPAHKIQSNEYSHEYLIKQNKLCNDVYWALNSFRLLLLSHPLARGHKIQYPNTDKYIIL